MLISRRTALKHIKAGNAECIGTMTSVIGATQQMYWIIDRFDKQRTDHVKVAQLGQFHLPLLGKFGYTGAHDAK